MATFSLFFPPPEPQWPAEADGASFCDDDRSSITTSPSSPSSSSTGSVDCTLSLGTPSSRRAAADPAAEARTTRVVAPPAAVSWDVPPPAAAADQHQPYYCCHQGSKPVATAGRGSGHDPLLVDRRCANCGTSSTPLWRNGPRGPKSLCNACGIRFKKEERRAAATAAMDHHTAAAAGCGYLAQRAQAYGAASAAKASPGAVSCCDGAFPDADAPFRAWRLNVVASAQAFAVWPERTTLFHYN